MNFVDIKYILLSSPNLRNFKKKNDNLYNCSCPICGDSEIKRSKARGYFYAKGGSMFYKCHNCGAGLTVANFLKAIFPSLHSEYILERYKNDINYYGKPPTNSEPEIKYIASRLPKSAIFVSTNATKISELEKLHYARTYVAGRKIPQKFYDDLFFTTDFAGLVEDIFPGKYPNLLKDDSRLVIPFYNKSGDLVGLQGRSFSSEKSLRYVTTRQSDDTKLIYGIERVDFLKKIFVVEGPIDSMFLENAVACANSNLIEAAKYLKTLGANNIVLIPDREPRNREIVDIIEKFSNGIFPVCLLPEKVAHKDINDIILSGITPSELTSIIDANTFSGLTLKLQFNCWKRI